MSGNEWKQWRFTVIHFREAIPCGKCHGDNPIGLPPRNNTTIYGVQQFGRPFDRHVEAICVECAADAVRRDVIAEAKKAYQQIVDEDQRQREMLCVDMPLVIDGADW